MQYPHLHKGVNTGDGAATSSKNLVIFGAISPKITFLIVYLCVVIGRKSVYDLYSSRWHFQTHCTIEMSMARLKQRGRVHLI